MRHRLPIAGLAIALALTACGSDRDDSTTDPPDATIEDTVDITEPGASQPAVNDEDDTDGTTTEASIQLADTAPSDADILIEAVGTTTDRSIRRGSQSEILQGQTFAVADDTTLSQVSFHVAAPEGVAAGQAVALDLYEVADTTKMTPSRAVDIADGAGTLVLALPEAIDPDTPTHLVFSLPDVTLSAGQYAVVLSFGDGSGPAEMFLQHPAGDVYADGVAISLEGEFWKSNTNDHDAAVTLTFDA